MFNSNGGDDDHLYDFSTNIDPSSQGMGYGGQPGNYGRAPMTSYRAPGTSSNRPPMSSMGSMGGRGNVPQSRGGAPLASRMGTGQQGGSGEARPMTSVSGAGYQGSSRDNRSFDPLNMGRGPAPPLAEKKDNSPEDQAKDLEKKVHRLIEASAEAVVNKDFPKALEKAKEAGK
eukprot:gene8551-11431_t